MGLEFIIGAASNDREMPLVEKARDWLISDPEHEVFYLVPNHIKFETEVSVLSKLNSMPPFDKLDRMASLRLQVFSFTRLAWYYLQNEEVYQAEQLSEASHLMLIRQILLEQADFLKIFKGEITKSGFIQQLSDLFNELEAGKVESSDLNSLVAQLGDSAKEKYFRAKLVEFDQLFVAYQEKKAGRQVGITQKISQLAKFLPQKDLTKVMFVISGFSRFTARERELIETLVQEAAEVKVNLVLDKGYSSQLPAAHSMFFDAGKVYFELYQFARQNKIKIYRDTLIKANQASDLGRLDEFWITSHSQSRSHQTVQLDNDSVKISQNSDTYDELSSVANEIRQLVETGNYRYQDIEILTRDIETYDKIISSIFKRFDIPFYVNNELSMTHHPLLEFLISLFNVHERQFRYTDIMRFLRTELMMPNLNKNSTFEEWQVSRQIYREKIDVTENVSLAYGYEGFYWTQEKDWRYVSYDYQDQDIELDSNQQAQIDSNEVRNHLRETLIPFYQEIKEAQTGKEGATLLYEFLVAAGVESELFFWRKNAIAAGDLEEAKIHEQTWQALMGLLDDYVTILGDQPFNFSEFITIITTGLEGLTYSKVPTTIDQVGLSSIDMIHEQKNKVTFIVGLTDSVFPKKIENNTLLSDDERQMVAGQLAEGKYLGKQVKADLIKEPYIAYLAFHSASDKLYLSFPAGIDGKKDVKPSPYLTILSKGLNITIKKSKKAVPEIFAPQTISTYRNLLSDLLRLKEVAIATGEQLAPEYVALEKKLLKNDDYNYLAIKLFASLTAKNIPEKLNHERVDELYSSTIHGSVSKIENFHQCQYKYFMTYGLKLKERDTFELSPAATGEFFHDALDQLFKVLIKEQLVLSELTTSDLKAVTEEVLQGVLGEDKFSILSASPRMNYIRHQLSQTIQRVSQALREHSMRTGMTTVQTEVLFGQIAQQQGLDGLKIDLANKKSLDIRGKIDRLDHIQVGSDDYVAVVDYKSSRHTFDYCDAYFGLAMQMITYLDVALRNATQLVGKEGVKPAGAFYLQIKNPTVDGSLGAEEAKVKLLKEFTYNGVLLDQPELLDKLDRTVIEQESSLVFPYKQKKNGDYTSPQFVSEADMTHLIAKNRDNFKDAGEKIFAGETNLNPAYRDKTRVACQFCQYRSICQFDVMLKENNYNRIEQLKKEEVISKIKENKTTNSEGGEPNDNQ